MLRLLFICFILLLNFTNLNAGFFSKYGPDKTDMVMMGYIVDDHGSKYTLVSRCRIEISMEGDFLLFKCTADEDKYDAILKWPLKYVKYRDRVAENKNNGIRIKYYQLIYGNNIISFYYTSDDALPRSISFKIGNELIIIEPVSLTGIDKKSKESTDLNFNTFDNWLLQLIYLINHKYQ